MRIVMQMPGREARLKLKNAQCLTGYAVGTAYIIMRIKRGKRWGKMLKPAQLYEEQLKKENIKAWYRPENIFWNGGTGDCDIDLPNNNYDSHCFVSVDKDDNVVGYITYCVDWAAMSADRFGIISFDKGNVLFAKDVYTAICDLFEKYHMNRIQWCAYADNPAIRGYRNFIRKHGGRECGHYRQAARLQDGRLHDSVCFEILAEEWRK